MSSEPITRGSAPDTLTYGAESQAVDPQAELPFSTPRDQRLAPGPIAQRWLQRTYWGLFTAFIVLALLYAATAWRNQRQIMYDALDTSSSFLVTATQSYFQGYSSVLEATGADLEDKADLLDHPEVLQILLERRQALLPGSLSVNVVSMDGRLLGSSMRSDNLPDLRHYPALMAALDRLRALPKKTGLIIGRPLIGPLTGHWIIPLVREIPAGQKHPAFYVIAAVSTQTFLQQSLANTALPYTGLAAVLARDDGHVLARWPAPQSKSFFASPQRGGFLQSLIDHPAADSAHYDAWVAADGETRMGSWQRLQTHSDLAVAVSVPRSLLWSQYLRTIWPPMVGLVVLLLLLTALYRYARSQIVREQTQALAQQRRLRTLAITDPLTAVGNRALLRERLEEALESAWKRQGRFALLLLDLDGFKQVNDAYGHSAGDTLLRETAQRLQAILREGEVMARMGGDEFAVLLTDGFDGEAAAEAAAQRILAAMRQPFDLGVGRQASISVSLGCAFYPEDGGDAETLLRRADLALYAAKSAGRDRYLRFKPDFELRAQREKHLLESVESALQQGRLLLRYQPIVAIGGDPARPAVVGVEALLRLRGEEEQERVASDFASVLDHGRMARAIGRFVLDQALTQGAQWQAEGLDLHIAVNISAEHLLAPEFLDDLQLALRNHPGFAASSLMLEVTESAPLRNLEQARLVLQTCQDLGVRVALDDFGTGSASLTYLQQLPAQAIKIDQSFVRDMVNDPKDFAIVSAVVTAANLLGLEVIGEGAETLEHLSVLAAMECTLAQGYAIARPLPAEAVPTWVQTWVRPVAHLHAAAFPHEVEVAQRRRVERLQQAVRGEAPFPEHVLETEAENQCHLGLWLHGQGRLYYGRDPRYGLLLEQHAEIHELARQAKAALDVGDQAAARRLGQDVAELSAIVLDGIRQLSATPQD
ncbi:EAL domain-containing protein [Thiomonas bhubaneswarensis]|uniref:Diguanylate cyclase (GGDEF) domain n=1 Tax=Thiomonas bhubaneswarensis TaxID=339866 RepID=A0A0K6HQN1_9BURK|nr:EAL domain-containing protein [Thiomonas bhubaneswarensis]CUA93083.1 diguanylate cyclase (GGDEF) domain [Thiomonas bhubaneswarensis]